MDLCDLFVEIKIRNVSKIINRWPRLEGKMAYWRVNGAQPEVCPKGGDEVNLICPIITACLWYGTPRYYQDETTKPVQEQSELEHLKNKEVSPQELIDISKSAKTGMNGKAYTFWPPYPRSSEYDCIDRRDLDQYEDPYCVCHNVYAWGYNEIVNKCVESFNLKAYGRGSPAGQISHRDVPTVATKAKALVHLKSVDCPGWALYEAILAGCPVITGRLLNSRMLAYDLLEHGVTCLEFGVPASLEYGRGDVNLDKCFEDIKHNLFLLEDSLRNYDIGQACKDRLNDLMWRSDRDGDSFIEFMRRWYG